MAAASCHVTIVLQTIHNIGESYSQAPGLPQALSERALDVLAILQPLDRSGGVLSSVGKLYT
jgi:hypothetical protein